MTLPKIDHFEAVRPPTDPNPSIAPVTIDGVSCYAFTLKPGDVQEWDKANIASGNTAANERAEISYEVAQGTLKGHSQWDVTPQSGKQVYRLGYRFKGGFPQSRWAVFTQFHPPDTWTGKHGFGGITGHGGNIDITDPTDDSGSVFIYRAPIRTDVWGFEWDLAVNWSATSDGYVVVRDRATGQQLVRWTGVTLPAGMAYKYVKQGYYRNPTAAEGTVYQTLIDVSAGDLAATATTPPATTPPDTSGTQTATQAYGAQLLATRNAMQKEVDAINALLGKP